MDIARLYWKGVTGLCSQVVHDLLDPAGRHVSPEDKDNDASDRKGEPAITCTLFVSLPLLNTAP